MGTFVNSVKVKARSRLDEVKEMDDEDIEDLLIRPAEMRLEEEFCLDLNTDGVPRHLAEHFETSPLRLTRFQKDMEICVVLLVDRMESNPHGHASQSVRGSQVVFGKRMPREIVSIMRQWSGGPGKTGRIVRT